MASDGILKKATVGRCEVCQRKRKTIFLDIIGEVRHGFAVGYKWKCANDAKCIPRPRKPR